MVKMSNFHILLAVNKIVEKDVNNNRIKTGQTLKNLTKSSIKIYLKAKVGK